MRDPHNSWPIAPIPEVPASRPAPVESDVPSVVRTASLLMVFVGALNLLREGLYTLGDITAYGHLTARDTRADLIALLFFGLCYWLARGLMRLEHAARWICLAVCPLQSLRMIGQIHYVLGLRASGYPHTELQLTCLLLLWALPLLTFVCLLTTPARRTFQNR